jgi:exportin-5
MEQRPQSPLERMQNFLATLHEHCYLILGGACVSFGHDFYSIPMLSEHLVNATLTDLDFVPDYRLRSLVRPFLKTFVSACPSSYYEVLALVLSSLCPYSERKFYNLYSSCINQINFPVYHRLSSKWQHIASLYDNGEIENPDTGDAQVSYILCIALIFKILNFDITPLISKTFNFSVLKRF